MKLRHVFTAIAWAVTAISAVAQATTLNTAPEGAVTYSIPATVVAENYTNYFAAPLATDPVYTGAVSAVTANTITIPDSPAPWTANQFQYVAASAPPYFVKFLTGLQAGRVILITANTTNSLTLDTTDHTTQTVALTTTGFSVAVGDTFEIFLGDTLSTLLGANTTQSPLILKPSTSSLSADTVGIYSPALHISVIYFFNSTLNTWVQNNTTVNANNVIIYPYSSFSITRRPSQPALTFTLMGRVPEVTQMLKITGSNQVLYNSTGYPVDMTLGTLNLGANWTKGTSSVVADTLSVWSPTLNKFSTYYQSSVDSNWYLSGGTVSQNSTVIPAGTTVVYNKRGSVSGATSFLQPAAPYTLGQ